MRSLTELNKLIKTKSLALELLRKRYDEHENVAAVQYRIQQDITRVSESLTKLYRLKELLETK